MALGSEFNFLWTSCRCEGIFKNVRQQIEQKIFIQITLNNIIHVRNNTAASLKKYLFRNINSLIVTYHKYTENILQNVFMKY